MQIEVNMKITQIIPAQPGTVLINVCDYVAETFETVHAMYIETENREDIYKVIASTRYITATGCYDLEYIGNDGSVNWAHGVMYQNGRIDTYEDVFNSIEELQEHLNKLKDESR
jgi:hypothetical protein